MKVSPNRGGQNPKNTFQIWIHVWETHSCFGSFSVSFWGTRHRITTHFEITFLWMIFPFTKCRLRTGVLINIIKYCISSTHRRRRHGRTISRTGMPQSEVRFVPTVGRATAENMNSFTAILGPIRSLNNGPLFWWLWLLHCFLAGDSVGLNLGPFFNYFQGTHLTAKNFLTSVNS